jgi:hypothetical protein
MEKLKKKDVLSAGPFGRKDTLLASCIQNIIESAYNQNEKTKRDELVATRRDLKTQVVNPSYLSDDVESETEEEETGSEEEEAEIEEH